MIKYLPLAALLLATPALAQQAPQPPQPPQLTLDQWRTAAQTYRSELSQAQTQLNDLSVQVALDQTQIAALQAAAQKAAPASPMKTK